MRIQELFERKNVVVIIPDGMIHSTAFDVYAQMVIKIVTETNKKPKEERKGVNTYKIICPRNTNSWEYIKFSKRIASKALPGETYILNLEGSITTEIAASFFIENGYTVFKVKEITGNEQIGLVQQKSSGEVQIKNYLDRTVFIRTTESFRMAITAGGAPRIPGRQFELSFQRPKESLLKKMDLAPNETVIKNLTGEPLGLSFSKNRKDFTDLPDLRNEGTQSLFSPKVIMLIPPQEKVVFNNRCAQTLFILGNSGEILTVSPGKKISFDNSCNTNIQLHLEKENIGKNWSKHMTSGEYITLRNKSGAEFYCKAYRYGEEYPEEFFIESSRSRSFQNIYMIDFVEIRDNN